MREFSKRSAASAAEGKLFSPLSKFCRSPIRCLPIACISLCLLPAACRKPADPAISVQATLTPQPVRKGLENVAITLTDRSAAPIANAKIGLEADMAHPGMSPVFGQAIEKSPGRYVGALELNMGGDWVVLMHIHLPDGSHLDQQINVPGVQSN